MNVRATALLVRRLVALAVIVGLWEALAGSEPPTQRSTNRQGASRP